jgi:hypothetical protein
MGQLTRSPGTSFSAQLMPSACQLSLEPLRIEEPCTEIGARGGVVELIQLLEWQLPARKGTRKAASRTTQKGGAPTRDAPTSGGLRGEATLVVARPEVKSDCAKRRAPSITRLMLNE